MFNVQLLRRWDELCDAILYLSERGHRFHRNLLKNWDLRLTAELADGIDQGGTTADLGASTLGADQ